MHKKLVGTVGMWEQTPETLTPYRILRSHITAIWWEQTPQFVGTALFTVFPQT